MADDDLSNDGDFNEDKDETVGDAEDVTEDEDNEGAHDDEEGGASDVETDKIGDGEEEAEGDDSEGKHNEGANDGDPNDVSDVDPDDTKNVEGMAEAEPLETKDGLESEPGKNSKKKIILISGVSLCILLLLTVGGFFWLSDAGGGKKLAEGEIMPPPGYIASVAVPPRKRKRMKTGGELAREKTGLKRSKKSRITPDLAKAESQLTQTQPQGTKAFGSNNKTEQGPASSGSTTAPPPTVQVIGARVVPGKGLMMPSVTAASYQAVPMKIKSEPISAPDESLMETQDGKVVPKLSESGKASWQTYSYRFTPTLQPAIVGAEGTEAKPKEFARISIIIRGLGLNRNATLAAINKLPAAISLVFSPYSKGLEEWASLARGAGHEVLMSLPMEPMDFPSSDAGPLALLTDLELEQNVSRLAAIMNLTQAYVGFVQNMGSRFATSEVAFKPMLKILKERGLLFVDDGLVQGGLGPRLAFDLSLPHARSDLIIDDDASGVKIAQNLLQLETIAKKNQSSLGLAKTNQTAIGIGEAYPATLLQVNRWAKSLKAKMIDLAPVTAVVRNNFAQPREVAAGASSDEKPKEQQ